MHAMHPHTNTDGKMFHFWTGEIACKLTLFLISEQLEPQERFLSL